MTRHARTYRRAQGARVLVFDLGGVLIDWNPRYLYRRLRPPRPRSRISWRACARTPGTTLLERYSLEPGECLFIDDVATNVEAARAVGMAAVVFTGADELRRELARVGLRLTSVQGEID